MIRLEVLKLKLQGMKPQQIAEKLNLKMSEVYRHDTEIKRQMAKEKSTDISKLDPMALEAVTATVSQLLPYMEKSTSKVLTASKGLKPLHDTMLENSEMVQVLISKALLVEIEKDEPKVAVIERLSHMLNDSYKAFFNKDGIQVVNILNDMSPNEERAKTADVIRDLKEERERLLNVIDVPARSD